MEIRDLAEAVLYGTQWGDKLIAEADVALTDTHPGAALAEKAIPDFPGRPKELARVGRSRFPSVRDLEQDAERGRILHFFANHELLAMELMALALLRFPDAPEGWRRGVAHTLLEEQEHMRLYRDRMQALGVGFGDLAVNALFWRRMNRMRSPLDYVTMMSLTFEQANLDFCVHYRDAIAQVGDHDTANILQRVYDDEIGHVGHGSEWFDRLRPVDSGDQWDAYRKLLPPPLTAARARGIGFDIEGRRRAGIDERFIAELQVCGASKGRPPVLWWFNPFCEQEDAALTAIPAPQQQVMRDLATVPGLLAQAGDVVWVDHEPESDWRQTLQDAGWALPEFRCAEQAADLSSARRIESVEPWGWSERARQRFHSVAERCDSFPSAAQPAEYASKLRSAHWLIQQASQSPPITLAETWAEVLAAYPAQSIIVKAAYGTAGGGLRRLAGEPKPSDQRWVEQCLATDGAVVVEPWHERVMDLSHQCHIDADGRVRSLGVRHQMVDQHGRWRGMHIGAGLAYPDDAVRDWLHRTGAGEAPLAQIKRVSLAYVKELAEAGYRGAAATDAFVYRSESAVGGYALHPLVECNPRWTMGRVALAVESHLAPGVRGWWGVLSVARLRHAGWASPAAWVAAQQQQWPLQRRGTQLTQAVLATSDCERDDLRVVSVLLCGDACAALDQLL